MGVELRRVPSGWEHPTESDYSLRGGIRLAYQPPAGEKFRSLNDDDWAGAMRDWWHDRIVSWAMRALWYWPSIFGWCDPPVMVRHPPDESDKPPDYWMYRPRWKKRDQTHYQLYQTVSEGSPISPVFATLEELATWAAAQEREVWVGVRGLSYDEWMRFLDCGYAPSMVVSSAGIQSGVEHMAKS